jgi:hypothetical protein
MGIKNVMSEQESNCSGSRQINWPDFVVTEMVNRAT